MKARKIGKIEEIKEVQDRIQAIITELKKWEEEVWNWRASDGGLSIAAMDSLPLIQGSISTIKKGKTLNKREIRKILNSENDFLNDVYWGRQSGYLSCYERESAEKLVEALSLILKLK